MFQNPHVYGILIIAMTALLTYAFNYTVDPVSARKALYKTLAAGALSVGVITWIATRPSRDAVLSEPFVVDTTSA